MAIRSSSDPNVASIVNSLAGLFAPPDAQSIAAYADAGLKRQKLQQLADFFEAAKSGDQKKIDQLGIGSGTFAPTQSFQALQTESGDRRYGSDQQRIASEYGSDRQYEASTGNNRLDNQTKLLTDGIMHPLNPGETRPGVTPDMLAALGFPGVPNIAPAAGTPKPLTDSEVKGGVIAGLPASDQRAIAMSGVDLASILGPDGKPSYVLRPDAVGKTPYTKPDGTPTLKIATDTATGKQIPVIFDDATQQFKPTQPGDVLPPNATITDFAKPQGSMADIGLTNATKSQLQGTLLNIRATRMTATKLLDMIKANPAAQGTAGDVRGIIQDALETGGEVAQLLGQQAQQIETDIKNGVTGLTAGQMKDFDPAIPKIDMLTNTLAYQYAAAQSPDGRVSDKDYDHAKKIVSGGIFSNQKDSTARLTALIGQMDDLEALYSDPNNARPGSGGANAASLPVVTTDDEYEKLAPGTTFVDETGKRYTKPAAP